MTRGKMNRPSSGASHFNVAEVTLRALNDPLPANNPESPVLSGGYGSYYDIDLERIIQDQNRRQQKTYPVQSSNPELTYPSVSQGDFPDIFLLQELPNARLCFHKLFKAILIFFFFLSETKRLLNEVANVRKQYEKKSGKAT